MKYILFIFLAIPLVTSMEIGDACLVYNVTGVCKRLFDCEYALKLVKNGTKPVHCGWSDRNNREELVCCPLRVSYGPVETPLPAEPKGCPEIPALVKAPTRDSLAFRKCHEYQRYLYPCVVSYKDPNVYARSPGLCSQKAFGSPRTPAAKGEFPHMASLGYYGDNKIQWGASGTLISQRYILTTARVLYGSLFGTLKYALIGAESQDTKEGLLYTIIQLVPHELFDSRNYYNDIGLVLLDRSVMMSEFIVPACLPLPDMTARTEGLMTDWEKIGNALPRVLHKTSIYVYNSSACTTRWGVSHLSKGWPEDTMICARTEEPCNEEGRFSGSPLQRYSEELQCGYVVEGIFSWGSCSNTGPTEAFTRVLPYVDWITDIVWPTG